MGAARGRVDGREMMGAEGCVEPGRVEGWEVPVGNLLSKAWRGLKAEALAKPLLSVGKKLLLSKGRAKFRRKIISKIHQKSTH